MHGATFKGDGGKVILDLADIITETLSKPESYAST
jgi:hypothetical protein